MYNKVKDIISDALGLAIWIVTLVLLLKGSMTFIWEGLTGIAVGSLFFMVSDDGIVALVKKLIDVVINKLK